MGFELDSYAHYSTYWPNQTLLSSEELQIGYRIIMVPWQFIVVVILAYGSTVPWRFRCSLY